MVIGESDRKTPEANELNTYTDVRIPVRSGDVIGFYLVDTAPCFRDVVGYQENIRFGDIAPGIQASFDADLPNDNQLNVSAVLEPDADGDRFGDETQDGCPTDPSTQGPCPEPGPGPGPGPAPGPGPGPGPGALTLDLQAKNQELRKKIKFFATASVASTLTAEGKKIKETTEQLAANQETKVKAKLKRKARNRLEEKLEEKGKAKVKVKGTATNQSGAEATDTVKVKLKH